MLDVNMTFEVGLRLTSFYINHNSLKMWFDAIIMNDENIDGLSRGHMSKQCPKRSECKICSQRHPTSLHETFYQPTSEEKHEKQEMQSTKAEETIKEKEASCHKVASMVLPVYLSSLHNPKQEILVYALLDTMSDTTFNVGSVGDELQVPSDAAMLRLTTMTDRCKNIPCRRFENLVVRGFKSATKVPPPAAYSGNSIPLDEAHIPTPETASQWPHLNSLSNQLAPKQDCPICLLIGYNCAQALAPKNCIPGKNDEPLAVETGLGWSIVSGFSAGLYREL